MKIHKIKAVCLCLCICFLTACGGNARQESGSANQSAPADTTLRLLQGIWTDIGYHFYITLDGVVHACRPVERRVHPLRLCFP